MIDAVSQVQQVPEVRRQAVVERLEELWEWRCADGARAADASDDHELSAVAWWFLEDALPPEWRLSQLLATQLNRVPLELDGRVLERLAELAARFPAQVLECLQAIVRSPVNQRWGIYDDHVKEIIRAGLNTADPGLHEAARALADYIGSLGFSAFREFASE
jgi:hypothetical protein